MALHEGTAEVAIQNLAPIGDVMAQWSDAAMEEQDPRKDRDEAHQSPPREIQLPPAIEVRTTRLAKALAAMRGGIKASASSEEEAGSGTTSEDDDDECHFADVAAEVGHFRGPPTGEENLDEFEAATLQLQRVEPEEGIEISAEDLGWLRRLLKEEEEDEEEEEEEEDSEEENEGRSLQEQQAALEREPCRDLTNGSLRGANGRFLKVKGSPAKTAGYARTAALPQVEEDGPGSSKYRRSVAGRLEDTIKVKKRKVATLMAQTERVFMTKGKYPKPIPNQGHQTKKHAFDTQRRAGKHGQEQKKGPKRLQVRAGQVAKQGQGIKQKRLLKKAPSLKRKQVPAQRQGPAQGQVLTPRQAPAQRPPPVQRAAPVARKGPEQRLVRGQKSMPGPEIARVTRSAAILQAGALHTTRPGPKAAPQQRHVPVPNSVPARMPLPARKSAPAKKPAAPHRSGPVRLPPAAAEARPPHAAAEARPPHAAEPASAAAAVRASAPPPSLPQVHVPTQVQSQVQAQAERQPASKKHTSGPAPKKARQTHIPMQVPVAVHAQGVLPGQSPGNHLLQQTHGQLPEHAIGSYVQGQLPGQRLGQYHMQGHQGQVYLQGGQQGQIYMQNPDPQFYTLGQQGQGVVQVPQGQVFFMGGSGPLYMHGSTYYHQGVVQGQQVAAPSSLDQLTGYFLEKYPYWSSMQRGVTSGAQGYPAGVWCRPH